MARVAQIADEPGDAPQQAARAHAALKPKKRSWSIGWALAGVLALLLVAVGMDDNWKSAETKELLAAAQRGQADSAKLNQLMELLTSNSAQKVSLHETAPAARQPEGRVIYAAHSGKLLLTASNLHPLPDWQGLRVVDSAAGREEASGGGHVCPRQQRQCGHDPGR